MQDKSFQVKHQFDRSAKTYHQFGLIQYHVAKILAEWIDTHHPLILDIGAGSGFLSNLLRVNSEKVFLMDISYDLLIQATRHVEHRIQGDFNQLPFASQVCDAATANMALHWAQDFNLALRETHRVLRPGGMLYFSVPLTQTFHELYQAGQALNINQNYFPTLQQIIASVEQENFIVERAEEDSWQLCFDSIDKVLRSMKATGVTHVNKPTHQALRGKNFLNQLEQAYQAMKTCFDQLPLTYHVGFIKAKKI
jgi:malonyl-CoA O-methyltransferase